MQAQCSNKYKDTINVSFYKNESTNALINSFSLYQAIPNNFNDNKFYQMITKTNSLNLLNKIENFLNSSSYDDNSKESYMNNLTTLLFDVIEFTSNPPVDKNDYIKALKYQFILIEKMITIVQKNLSDVDREE
jgi:hypothetical protein